ncbi:MAG: T9SS type A sorting domain-containing protein [Saprospiraceae bacterium]|nr:T9SS type A sorting domain-containing protein [Candidatus Opimibacter skivensis]
MLGQSHYQGFLSGKTIIQTNQWPPGIYFIHVGAQNEIAYP